jgi:hypothetical protein
MKYKDLPKEIYFEEKVGSNGIHCLDYKNESDVKYIRADVVAQMLVSGLNTENGQLTIHDVSQLRELLLVFKNKVVEWQYADFIADGAVDYFLENKQ